MKKSRKGPGNNRGITDIGNRVVLLCEYESMES